MVPTYLNTLFVLIALIFFYIRFDNKVWAVNVLLFFSLFFYFWMEPYFLIVLIYFALISFLAGYFIFKNSKYKKLILNLFLIGLLSIFIPLKYSDVFNYVFNIFSKNHNLYWLYLPLGFSFHTFQVISYVLDIYFDKYEPEKSFRNYLLYVSYFPQITCGPIGRADHFLPQLENLKKPSLKEIYQSTALILQGLFKKLVLADSLFFIISGAYRNPNKASGLEWIFLSVLTRYFIFYDFSGYTDISRGVSSLFGLELSKNFNHPFKAKSIADFWRRWHISLSSWIRDYIYFPLASLSHNRMGIYLSLVISFVLLGLWHGSTAPFILYGLINGVAVAISSFKDSELKRRGIKITSNWFIRLFSRFSLFLFLICLPSILLLSGSIDSFALILSRLLNSTKWLKIKYFTRDEISIVIYYTFPLMLIFETALVNYENKFKDFFYNLKEYKKVFIFCLIIFIICFFYNPRVGGRFFYQDF